jgi:diaminopimelate decarboxylase
MCHAGRRFFPRVDPFYAVKCNPDPVIIKTLAILGCNFDCASRNEFRLVHELTADLPTKPEIIFANPCKPRAHVIEAVCKGIKMVTFDNEFEIEKCANISKSIELILRIITDDRGSVCRLSSKFGAPRAKWDSLLATAKLHGMKVVGVSFHVGSGCRDASRYEAALRDAKEIFDLAESKFGMKMSIVDIGGGFPGETHSLWNPAEHIDNDEDLEDVEDDDDEKTQPEDRFMFFTEIAQQVAPVIDQIFPVDSGVRIIGEPGRYFVAAAATLCCSVVSARFNAINESHKPERLLDSEYSQKLNELSREEEIEVVRQNKMTMTTKESDDILQTIHEELAEYSKLYANTQIVGQEVDVYTDRLDLYNEGLISAVDQLGPPLMHQMSQQLHTVEGLNYQLVTSTNEDSSSDPSGLLTLAAAGEAAVKGVVIQAVADSAPLQDDYGTLEKLLFLLVNANSHLTIVTCFCSLLH